MGHRRRRTANPEPPQPLTDWHLFATLKGHFDPVAHTYDESKINEWKRARRDWAMEHGWPNGELAMLAEELALNDEANEPYEDGLPHGGAWSRPLGEVGYLLCAAHGLQPEAH